MYFSVCLQTISAYITHMVREIPHPTDTADDTSINSASTFSYISKTDSQTAKGLQGKLNTFVSLGFMRLYSIKIEGLCKIINDWPRCIGLYISVSEEWE